MRSHSQVLRVRTYTYLFIAQLIRAGKLIFLVSYKVAYAIFAANIWL